MVYWDGLIDAETVVRRFSVNQACNFIKKEPLAQVFSCEFCEIFKNIFFYRTTLVAASIPIIKSVLLEEYYGSKVNIQRSTVFETHSTKYDFE